MCNKAVYSLNKFKEEQNAENAVALAESGANLALAIGKQHPLIKGSSIAGGALLSIMGIDFGGTNFKEPNRLELSDFGKEIYERVKQERERQRAED